MSSQIDRLFAAAELVSGDPRTHSALPKRRKKASKTDYGSHENYQFNVSKWNAMLHEIRTNSGGVLAAARRKIQNTVADHNLENDPKGAVKDAIETSTGFSRELFSRLYSNPQALDDSERHGPDWMNEFQERVSDLPEWEELRKNVSGDADFSAIATAGIMDRIADDLAKYMKRKQEQSDDESDDGSGGIHGVPGLTAEDGLMASVAQACADASSEVKDAKSALSSLVPGTEKVPSGIDQEDPKRMEMAERLLRMPDVRDIIERCGRIQRIASRNKPAASKEPEEITGISVGDDVRYMLLTEAIDLLTEDLEALFFMRYAEKNLLQYDRESVTPQGRGPIVVLLDESGSMNGENHQWARAVGAACIAMGMKESRSVTVIGFNSGIRSVYKVDEDGNGMELSPSNPSVVECTLGSARLMMQVMVQNCSGGTDYDTVLDYALKSGVRDERADLIFVTDDACSVSQTILSDIKTCREENDLYVYGMTIGAGSLSGAVQEICDEVVDLSSGDVGNLVGTAFRSNR